MKKIIALILAIMLVASLSVTAFAAGSGTGSITLKDVAVEKQADGTYKTVASYGIYKMFNLDDYNAEKKTYVYSRTTQWMDFLAYANAEDRVSDYLKLNENGVSVEWVEVPNEEDRAPRAAKLAKLALEFAESQSMVAIRPDKVEFLESEVTTVNGKTTATLTFTGLDLGYYLVDSTMGVLCGLTTTNPDVNMAAKNAPPTLNMQVEEDALRGSGASWDVENDAEIGEIVEFDITITVHAGAQNYYLHCKMDPGLEYVSLNSLKHHVTGQTDHTLAPTTDYVITTQTDDGCAFHVEFTKEFCEHVGTGDRVVMLFKGKLNKDAVIGQTGNKATAWLTFGENSQHTTAQSITTTRTWSFDLAKVDSERTLLNGATFKVYRSATGNDEIKVVAVEEGGQVVSYRLATQKEIDDGQAAEKIVVANGWIKITGFDSDTYYLHEVEPPAGGYTPLASRKDFIIDEQNLDVTINTANNKAEIGTGVQVVNKAGNILPQTGGIGTLLFTLLGGCTALGTGVVLVTKKRMSKIED